MRLDILDNVNLDDLTNQKNNIFEHVFYEFSMYHHTFFFLKRVIASDSTVFSDKQFWINVLLESHATHLRNLIHFFSSKDSMNGSTILKTNPKLGFSDDGKKTRIINHAISHMDIERVDASTGTDNLTVQINELINSMYPEICSRIRKYLNELSNASSINDKYISEFYTPEIQERYKELLCMFSN